MHGAHTGDECFVGTFTFLGMHVCVLAVVGAREDGVVWRGPLCVLSKYCVAQVAASLFFFLCCCLVDHLCLGWRVLSLLAGFLFCCCC